MFSEWKGPRMPQTGAAVAGCSSAEMGLLPLEVYYTSTPFLSWVQDPIPPPSPFILPSFTILGLLMCVCTCMHACFHVLVTGLYYEARQPSWGDAWVPPVNFTAFIWPDEWLAALSVPLPAISSGSLEPHSACSFGRSLQQAVFLPLFTHTHIEQRHCKQRRTITYR